MEIAVTLLTSLLILLGSAWVFLPFISGPLLAWCGLLACHLLWPAGPVGGATLVFTFVLVVVAKAVDALASLWSARRFGASWAGAFGAVCGGVVFTTIGLFTGAGLILCAMVGPAVGAVLAELAYGKTGRAALLSGVGAFLGYFVSAIFSLAVCGVMGALFAIEVVVHLVSR